MTTHHYTGPAPVATCSSARPAFCSTDWALVDCTECLIRRIHIDEQEKQAHSRVFRWNGSTGCLTAVLHDFALELKHPLFNFHALLALGADPDDMHRDAAVAAGVDLAGEWSEDVFPVEVAPEDVDPDDYCAGCMVRFSDGATMAYVSVLLMEHEDGTLTPIGYFGYRPGMEVAGIPGAPDLYQANTVAASVHEAAELALTMAAKLPAED